MPFIRFHVTSMGMFTGIIEATSRIVKTNSGSNLVRIEIERPTHFSEIKLGDSIAVNGVCLTIEGITINTIQFALAAETIKVLNIDLSRQPLDWGDQVLNLERSLVFGGRVDGHFVTGHVDTRIRVVELMIEGESWILKLDLPESLKPYVWPKGSCALNGVSLTINEVGPRHFSVCLIPETIKRTNFVNVKAGDWINFEIDTMARGIVHNLNWMQAKDIK